MHKIWGGNYSGKRKKSHSPAERVKTARKKFTMVTAYDYLFASMVDKSPIEVILVGDSLGMVITWL